MIASNRVYTGLTAAVSTLGLVAACSGATAPDKTTSRTFEVTTNLRTVTQRTTDCPATGNPCPYGTSPGAVGSSLAGTLTLGDSFTRNGMVVYPVNDLRLSKVECFSGGTKCSSEVSGYWPDSLVFSGDTLAKVPIFYMQPDGGFIDSVELDRAVFAGDSITGTLSWRRAYGVYSRWINGTFIMKRRR